MARTTIDSGFDDKDAIGITSQGFTDTSALSAGTYRNVAVKAVGNWTLCIAPTG
jgi:hypothetical protein